MAAFANMEAAEARAKAKSSGTGDGTWMKAHAGRTFNGVICVRVIRFMVPALVGNGNWVELTDNTQV